MNGSAVPPGSVDVASLVRILLVSGAVILVVGAGADVGGAGPTAGSAAQGASVPEPGDAGQLVEGHSAHVVLEIGPVSS